MASPNPKEEPVYRGWPSHLREGPSLEFQPTVIDDLALRVLEGVKALPRRGLEIGGLLVGTISDSGHICVDDLCPLHSDYPEGPVLRVSEDDFMAAVDAAQEKGQIVGLYRSRTDGKLDLDDQTRFMLQALLAGPSVLSLFIRQTRNTPAEARAGLWDGSVHHWVSQPVLVTKWLRGEEASVPEPAEAPTPAVIPPSKAAVEPVAPAPVLPPAFPADLIPAENTHIQQHRIHPAAPRRGIGRGLVLAAAAAAVVLLVLNLRPRPKFLAEQPKTAAVVRHDPLQPRPEVLSPAAPTPKQAAREEPRQPAKSVPQVAINVPVTPDPEPTVIRARTETRKFHLPPAKTHTQAASDVPAAEPPRVLAASVPVSAPLDLSGIRAIPAPTPPVQTSRSVQTATLEFSPPQLVRQPRSVVLPPDLRRLLQHEVVLSMKVNVDASGRVSALAPVTGLGKLEESLWRAYSAAVSTWEFEPAIQNGKRVPAETILRFRVVPTS